jgi:hypothetical protein
MAVESQAPESSAPAAAAEQGGQVHQWFRALFRALFIILLTLAVLAAIGLAADVGLHRLTHTSHTGSSYSRIDEIDVVLDGDGSVSVTGSANSNHAVSIAETDNSTMFDHPQRTIGVIGGTLFVTVRCPDSLCTANLALTTTPDTVVNIRVGNALRLDRATVAISGLTGPVDLAAWPAKVTIARSTSIVTGMVAGSLSCGAPAVCIVQVPVPH